MKWLSCARTYPRTDPLYLVIFVYTPTLHEAPSLNEKWKCWPVSRRSAALVLASLALVLSLAWGLSSLVNSMILLWLILSWTSLKRLEQAQNASPSEYSLLWPNNSWKSAFPRFPLYWSSSSTRCAPKGKESKSRKLVCIAYSSCYISNPRSLQFFTANVSLHYHSTALRRLG